MNTPADRADATGTPRPTPRRRPLKTLDDVRRELASLYWLARHQKLPTQEATRLVYILTQLARVIEGGEFERRVADLESRIEMTAQIAPPATYRDATSDED